MSDFEARLARFREDFRRLVDEIHKVVVGQDEVIESTLIGLFAGGHCLLEGVPGLGKTLLVKTLASILDLKYSRIQFTPDLMPADIIGTRIVMEGDGGRRHFEFQRGPIFGQVVLADEVNRATPKTQSALLEAMQEHSVTVGRERHALELPFIVLATQNPLEMDGTYELPEAQLDRFMFKVHVGFPTRKELAQVVGRTTDVYDAAPVRILNGAEILDYQKLVREIVVAPHVRDFAIRLVLATHPDQASAPENVKRFVRFGASPRGAHALVLGGKIRAALDRRYNVSFQDLRETVLPGLRHRVLLNFEGEAEGRSVDALLGEIVQAIPEVAPDAALAS